MINVSKETYELAKIFTLVQNAQIRGQVLMNENSVSGPAKHWIKTSIVNRLNAIINDTKFLFRDSPEDLEIMKRDLLDDDTSLQAENIQNLFLSLPKGIRDEVETYIEQRHFTYSRKTA